jgi:hypothetical protein
MRLLRKLTRPRETPRPQYRFSYHPLAVARLLRAFQKRNGGTDGPFPSAFQTNPQETVYKFLTTRTACSELLPLLVRAAFARQSLFFLGSSGDP